MTGNHRKNWLFFIGLLLFFLGMYARYGIGVYNDSEQYITMHIHREPLYPLFLALFRAMAGADAGLKLAVIVQGILAAGSIFCLAEYLRRRFSLGFAGELVLILLQLAPHIVTRYVSAYGIFIENSIMSEALCMPLFQIYMLFLLRMVFEGKKTDILWGAVFAWLLSMTRGQMMTAVLVWFVVWCGVSVARRQYRTIIAAVLAVACAFGLRSLAVHTYNYFVTGYFMGNTYGQVNLLTNVIYACDQEDGEVFGEDSRERNFFDQFYAEADEMGANYRYGGDTFEERAAHLEDCHDTLKFEVLDAGFSKHFWDYAADMDYYKVSRMSDETAGVMIAGLLPGCFGQWLYDYALLCSRGFIRSIAVVHPLINWLALFAYAAAAALAVWRLCREKKSDAAWFMLIALLAITANVCATSLTIMCLSRYMIYGFSIFYMAFFLLGREYLPDIRRWLQKRIKKREV